MEEMISTKKMTESKKKLLDRYNSLKIKMNQERSSETLSKYKILSEAYKIGKELYGARYSQSQLCIDFDMEWSTVHRVLSLDRASKYAWKMIEENKITAHKVAQICMAIRKDKQDDIIKTVIKDGLSTYQIKKLRVYNDGNFREMKLAVAVEKGFSTKWNAMHTLIRAINRMEELLKLNIDSYPPEKKTVVQEKLQELKTNIDLFLKKTGGGSPAKV